MSEGKFAAEVHRRLCELDEEKTVNDPIGPLGALLDIANDVAREHPAWYERFRIGAMIRRFTRRITR